MKNFNSKYYLLFLALVVAILGVFSSCDSDNETSPLTITSVVKAQEGDLIPVNQGDPNNFYIIRGTGLSTVQKIYFNDFDTYFNPVYVTDTEIFVLIDEKTPYVNASNKLKLVTSKGTISYDFLISPPAPIVTSINPINATEGTLISIKGNYFINPIVKIAASGNQPAIDVPIVTSTIDKIVVKLPANTQYRTLSVTTISGTATAMEAFGTAIYDDKLYTTDGVSGWGISNTDLANDVASDVAQGEKAIKVDIAAWSGFQIDMWANGGFPVPANAKGIRFQMKEKTAARMRVIVSGDWGHQVWFDVKNEFDTYVVKWSDLGLSAAPATVGQLTFGSDGVENTFYIDNVGFQM